MLLDEGEAPSESLRLQIRHTRLTFHAAMYLGQVFWSSQRNVVHNHHQKTDKNVQASSPSNNLEKTLRTCLLLPDIEGSNLEFTPDLDLGMVNLMPVRAFPLFESNCIQNNTYRISGGISNAK
jgi:hypothetical protein